MKNLCDSHSRARLLAILVLQGSAVGLMAPDAAASSWHYTIVDGPGSSSHGNSGNEIAYSAFGASAAIVAFGWAMPLYTRLSSTGHTYAMTGYDSAYGTSTCSSTDGFNIYSMDGPDVNSPTAHQDGSTTWFGYTDASGDLYAGISADGPGEGTLVWSADGNTPMMTGTPSIALLGAGTDNAYIFYNAYYTSGMEVHYKAYNSGTSTWSNDTVLDGPGISGPAVEYPAATYFDSKLWVFYWDQASSCLRGKYSSDGSSWTLTSAPGSSHSCIDGFGGTSGQNSDDVGKFPATYVDATGTTARLYVYYADYGSSKLRVSYLDAGGSSTWSAETVDSSVTIDAPPAPTLSTSAEVFYVDSVNHKLKANSKILGTWGTPSTIDGSGGPTGSTSDSIGSPVSVVERPQCSSGTGTGPHVFYADNTTHALREAFWW